MFCFECNSIELYKMSDIVNKFLLEADKFMPQMHLKQPGLTYSACGPFTKNKERIQKFMQTGNTNYIYKNDLDKACFQHDTTYEDFKDLAKKTASDKVLRDKAFNITKNPKYDGYQRGLASMVYKFFDKKSASLVDKSTSGSGVKSMSNQRLADELHKAIIKNFKKRKVNSSFKENVWGADLAGKQLISKFNEGFRFLLCFIDIFKNCAWIILWKDKKVKLLLMHFKKLLNNSKRKPNKIWVDKGREIYNRSMKYFYKIIT